MTWYPSQDFEQSKISFCNHYYCNKKEQNKNIKMEKKNFMNLPEEYNNKNSQFYILPIEYECNVTYGKGSDKGAKEIIKASHYLEYYDEQFDKEPFLKGIHTLKTIKDYNKISETIQQHKDKFILTIGGDHSITIQTTKNLDKNTSVIIFDAHADMFSSWNNSTTNHRCTTKTISNNHKTLIIGLRSMDIEEKNIIEQTENIETIKSYEYNKEILKKQLKNLTNKVYISIDVDVFDPSFIRNTGTPEPGGFQWNTLIDILEIIFKNKNVIGTDIVEFAPETNFRAEAYSLAKLCYKLFALKQKHKYL